MRSSEKLADLHSALVGAAAKLENPIASARADVQMKQGGRYSYTYAPLDEIATMVRHTLNEFGVACLQEALGEQGRVGIVTRFVHGSSGEWLELGPLWLPSGSTPQEAGSALTYARRYALTTALLLAAEDDDDGAKASQRATSARSDAPGVEGETASDTGDGAVSQPTVPGHIDPACQHKVKKTGGGLFECSVCGGVGKLSEFKSVAEATA